MADVGPAAVPSLSIADRVQRLTPRELEVAQYVYDGLLNKEMAAKMGVVSKTVEAHRKHMMTKMEFDRPALLVRALNSLWMGKE